MYPTDPLESPWRYDGTYQARHLALLDLIRIAAGGGGSGYDFNLLNQEATQLLIKGVLDDLKAKDFATEATLVAIGAVLDAIKVKTDNIDVALSTRATEAAQELNRLQLVDLNAKDFATELTLADIKAKTDLLNFTGAKLRTTGEDGGGGGGSIDSKLLQVDAVGTTTYVGYAEAGTLTSGATWAIKKIVETGSDVSITWADGNTTFDNIWDNRLTLTYS